MKTRIYSWCLMTAILMLSIACSDSDSTQSDSEQTGGTTAEDRQVRENSTLVSVLKSASYSPQEFVDNIGPPSYYNLMNNLSPHFSEGIKAFDRIKLQTHLPKLDRDFAAEVGTEPDGSRRWKIETYSFTYRSHTVAGEECVMSGRVTFPNNTVDGTSHQVKTLSLCSRQALSGNDWAASESMFRMPIRALWNSAVIEPDFQNYGVNFAQVPEGAASPKVLARQLADCLLAALELMRQHGVSLAPDGYTTNWASSQSCAVPLMFAKYYETEAPDWFRNAVKLHSTFTGEGPLYLPDAFLYLFKHMEMANEFYTYPCSYISAFTPEQLGGYTFHEFVAPWFTNTYVKVDEKEYTVADATSKMILPWDFLPPSEFTRLDQILSPDMVTADGNIDMESEKTKAVFGILEEHGDMSGWTPQHPIYIAHSEEDALFPYELAYEHYLRLSNQGQNPLVHFVTVPPIESIVSPLIINTIGVSYSYSYIHTLVSFIMQFYMSDVEKPEDMEKIYAGK